MLMRHCTWQDCWWHRGRELKLIPQQIPPELPQRSTSDWQRRRRSEARPRSLPADEVLLCHWMDPVTGNECPRNDWMPPHATCSLTWSHNPESRWESGEKETVKFVVTTWVSVLTLVRSVWKQTLVLRICRAALLEVKPVTQIRCGWRPATCVIPYQGPQY